MTRSPSRAAPPTGGRALRIGRTLSMPDRAIFSLSSCPAAAESRRRSISLHSGQTDPTSPGSRAELARVDGPVAPRAIPRSAIRRARPRMTGFDFGVVTATVDTDGDGRDDATINWSRLERWPWQHVTSSNTTLHDDGSTKEEIPSVMPTEQ